MKDKAPIPQCQVEDTPPNTNRVQILPLKLRLVIYIDTYHCV